MASIVEIIFKTIKQGSGEKLAKEAVTGVDKSLQSMAAGALKNVAPWAALGGALLTATQYLKDASKAAAANAEIMAKQGAVLKATGYSANTSAGELKRFADEAERLYHIDGDLISESQSLLATFRNIGREELPLATKAAINLQTTFGGLRESSMQLGVALNDPVAGIGRLAKSGVTFSETQKEQIKNFVAMNDLASAQGIILKEIENQVGGTAKAMAEAGDGSRNLTNATGALSESIGRNLLPVQREWNKALADTAWALADIVDENTRVKTSQAAATKEIGKSKSEIEWLIYNVPGWREKYAALNNEFYKGATLTERATAQYLAMGGSLADLNGITRDHTAIVEIDEEAIKSLTKTNQDYLKLVGSIADEQASFAEKQEEFASKRAEIEADLTEKIKQGYSEQSDVVLGLRGNLQELDAAQMESADKAKQAGYEKILSMLEQKLALDGLSTEEMSYLLELGQQWGVYSEESVSAANAAMREVDRLSQSIYNMPDGKTIRINIEAQQSGASGQFAYQQYATRDSGGPGMAGVPYVINPKAGPEVFVPQTNGTFIPNADRGGLGGPVDLSQSSIDALARALMTASAQMGR